MEYLGYICGVALLFLVVMFILNKRRVPVKHYIILAIVGGLLAAFASFFLELFADLFLRFAFLGHYEVTKEGLLSFYSYDAFFSYYLVYCFILIAPIEEISKNLIGYILNEKTEYKFLSYIECIMPYLIMGIAFSIIEDYLYIKNYDVGMARLMTFLTGHPLFAMIFGHFYYKYRTDVEIISMREIVRRSGGVYKKIPLKENKYIKLGILFVCLLHGFHNFISSVAGDYFYLFYFLEVSLFILVFVFMIINRKKSVKTVALKRFLMYYPEYTINELEEMGIKCYI